MVGRPSGGPGHLQRRLQVRDPEHGMEHGAAPVGTKTDSGKNTANWPGSTVTYKRRTRRLIEAHYHHEPARSFALSR